MKKPSIKPVRAFFSSGPTAKRAGWNSTILADSLIGRSHRSKEGKASLKKAIDLSRKLAEIPDDYMVGIMPASDTGAFECALWSLLGERAVIVLVWESFGAGWATDVNKELKLNATVLKSEYGHIPDFSSIDWSNDIVFTWNGTTSGVKVPSGEFIPDNRQGLVLCDATSAVFGMEIAWEKLDAITYSWQKVLGGEAGFGILILSPRAVERIENYDPSWPLPKIFRLKKKGALNKGIFEGETINTPSMICVQEYIDALEWGLSFEFNGAQGVQALIKKSMTNLATIESWVASRDWIEFLAEEKTIRSNTSVCLKIVAPWFTAMDTGAQTAFCKKIASTLDAEQVAYDINSYRDAPPGFRFWAGPTVDSEDLLAALAWLEWAYEESCDSH
ncbi:MAG: phosphoserine transaminase [bacterium]